jgi:hypothetical protein
MFLPVSDGGRTNADRDIYYAKTPARGVPIGDFSAEEVTGVHTDPQVFRAVKQLRHEQDKLTDKVERIDHKLDNVAESNAMVVGKLEILTTTLNRPRTLSSDIRMIQQTTTATLAEKVLDDHKESKRFSRAVILKIVTGVFSAGVLGAVVMWLLQKL